MSLFDSQEVKLWKAASAGKLKTVKRLLGKHSKLLNAVDSNGRHALYHSIANGQTQTALYLIECGADPSPSHSSPLFSAIQRKHFQVIDPLVKAGADVNFVAGRDGSTPLVAAIDIGNTDIVKYLLEVKANPDGSPKMNALHVALRRAGKYFDYMKTSRDAGSLNENRSLMEKFLEISHMLVDAGANLTVSDTGHQNSGITVLHRAAEVGDTGIAQRAIEAGVNVNATDEWDVSALGNAAGNGHVEMTTLLLDSGARVDGSGEGSRTPLCLAAWNGHPLVVELLLSRNANPHIRDSDGRLPLFYASTYGTPECVEILSRIYDANMQLVRGAEIGNLEMVQHALRAGAEIDARDEDGCTATILAAANSYTDIVLQLLELGADPDLSATKGMRKGMTPLMAAVRAPKKDPRLVEILKQLHEQGSRKDLKAAITHAEQILAPPEDNRPVIDLDDLLK